MFKPSLCVFHLIFAVGCYEGGVLSQGIGTQPANAFFSLHSSEIKISKTDFFGIVTSQGSQVQQVLHFLCVFWPWGAWGLVYALLQPQQLKNGTSFFGIVTTTMIKYHM
mmetsp:Transcript_37462/g.62321  ORF Transcript_37462/g.62321 Transcript_37462/m.62321 type:complete len:109 (+) Transcript_37462:37-363(+)